MIRNHVDVVELMTLVFTDLQMPILLGDKQSFFQQ